MGDKDGTEELEGILEARGEAVRQPNGLVPPHPSLALESSLRKGRETCVVQ